MSAPAGAGAAKLSDAGGGRFLISGALTLATVTALRGAGLRAFAQSGGAIDVDLSGVTRADSGALALLIDWLAWARAAGRRMKVSAAPPALLALARLSDVEEFLTGEAPAPKSATVAAAN